MSDTPTVGLPRLNAPAPVLSAKTTPGDRALADYKRKWLVLFSHPYDFTPVCTTEFIGFAGVAADLKAMNCELLGLSIDSIFSHIAWTRNIAEKIRLRKQRAGAAYRARGLFSAPGGPRC